MSNASLARVLMLVLFAATVGCATSRSEIKIGSPAMTAPASSSSSAQVVVIRTVKDERTFEEAPRDPSIPSLGFEGATQALPEIKARAIGRKRNTYGKALGDIILESDQTVEGVIRESLWTTFQQAGYQVKKDISDAGSSPLIVDVKIRQFWAWFKPGFWAITLNTHITTDLILSGDTLPVVVSVHAQEKGQMATDSSWIEIVEKALKEYRDQAVGKIPAPR
ncbi:MAG: flagellar biosynthesis protein [Nitrospirota bacterium]|nr:flagellar biosynthesis protein [Nitrospirota bacterium]